jgi:hypothetical protein
VWTSPSTRAFRIRSLRAIPLVRDGGEGGIRTHGPVLPGTRFPSVLLKPLGHLSSRFATSDTRSSIAGKLSSRRVRRPDSRVRRERVQLLEHLNAVDSKYLPGFVPSISSSSLARIITFFLQLGRVARSCFVAPGLPIAMRQKTAALPKRRNSALLRDGRGAVRAGAARRARQGPEWG